MIRFTVSSGVLIAASLLVSVGQGRTQEFEIAPAQKPATAGSKTQKSAEPPGRLMGRVLNAVQLDAVSSIELRIKTSRRGNRVLGITRALTAGQTEGAWERVSAGRSVWRLSLRSPGALALRVHFTAIEAVSGNVWVYPPATAGSKALGPYRLTETANHQLWSGLVIGDSAVIEYDPASGDEGPLPFHVASLAHVARPIGASLPLSVDSGSPHQRARVKDGGFGQTLACEVDVQCESEQWRIEAKSVGLLLAQEGDYVVSCSGTLLNNRKQNFRPYFLTANHCIGDSETAQNALVLWDFETDYCNGTVPDIMSLPQQFVAALLVTRPIEKGDYSLLLLDGQTPEDAVYAGWNTREPQMGEYVAGIHQPEATWKRFSAGNRIDDFDATVVDDSGNVMANAPADKYYNVSWNVGVTEPGSSGSGLFNRSGQLIGVLSHGNVDCGASGFDGYGRFGRMFSDLRRYLFEDRLSRH